ncbi:MAG: peptide deformylase [Patescibacteria group bacterium]
MNIPIVKLPAASLRQPSLPIDRREIKSKKIQELVVALIPTMYAADGIGIAAPQVGKNIRLCVIGKMAFKKHKRVNGANESTDTDMALINPSWVKLSKKTAVDVEGCLSVPGKQGKVRRYRDILVSAMNASGENVEFEAHGYLARVVQHEVDHLDGILFVDRAIEIYDTAKV